MYTDFDRELDLKIKVVPKFSVIGPKIDPSWFQRCSKSMQKWSNMVPKWSSGRLVAPMAGHVAILDLDADHDAASSGRFGKVFGRPNASSIN